MIHAAVQLTSQGELLVLPRLDLYKHLLVLGHRRIALVTAHPSLVLSRDAVIGYREALDGAGVRFDDSLVATPDNFSLGLTHRAVFELTMNMLRNKPYPDAFLIHGPVQGALAAIAAVGLHIPDDVSVVACGDDNEPAEFTFPACSHLVYRQARVGHIAMQLLLDVISGRLDKQTVKVPVATRLVHRDSIAPAKGVDR
jgi:DNA-binding LacI/PurR family transcriptional regulator